MTPWRVIHVNQWCKRHELHVLASTPEAAQEVADLAYGPATYCACMNLSRRRG